MDDASSSLDIETSSVENKNQCTGVWIFLIVCLTVTICIMTWLITRSTDSPCEPDGSSIYTPRWYTGSLKNPSPNVTDLLTTFKINFPPLQSNDYMVGVFKNHIMSGPDEISSHAVDGCEISIKRTYKAPAISEWDSDKGVLSSNSMQYVNGVGSGKQLMYAGISTSKTTTVSLYKYVAGADATIAITNIIFSLPGAIAHAIDFTNVHDDENINISGLLSNKDEMMYFNYNSSLRSLWSDPIKFDTDNIKLGDDTCCRVFGTGTGGFFSTGKIETNTPQIYHITVADDVKTFLKAPIFPDIADASETYSKSVIDITPVVPLESTPTIQQTLVAYIDTTGAMKSRYLTGQRDGSGEDTMKMDLPIEVFDLNKGVILKAHTFGRMQEKFIPLYVLYSLTNSTLYLAQYNFNMKANVWSQANKSVIVGTLDDTTAITRFNVMAIADPWGTSGDAICIQNDLLHKTLVISSNGENTYVSCENFDDNNWKTLTTGRRLIFPINDETRRSALEIVKRTDTQEDVLRVTATDELTYFVLGK